MDPINQEGSPALEEALNHEQDGEPGDNLLSLYAGADLWVSPGYHFAPKDHELIIFYVRKKINNEPICIRIRSTKVYQYSPWELTELYPCLEPDEWYFFTPRNQMNLFWKRPNRVAGNGYWKAYGTEITKVSALDPKKLQSFTKLDDCVLCRIHLKKLQPSSRKRKQVADSKSCKTKKQKTKKCVAIEHQGTSLQNNPPVPQSNHPMLGDGLLAEITTVPAQDTNIFTSR